MNVIVENKKLCLYLLEAISRYPLQSFVPNTGAKGFSLLSGLWDSAKPLIL
jgi:hypothetical protein